MSFQLVPLGKLTKMGPQYGANAKAVEPRDNSPRYVRITDIDDSGRLVPNTVKRADLDDPSPYILDEGDLLFARTGATVGKTYIYRRSDGPCVFAGYLIRFRLDNRLALPDYVFYYTKSPSYLAWVEGKKRVAAQPNINASEYAGLDIPLPPLTEQRRIVDILDQADALCKKRAEADAKAARFLPALFYKMFGDPFSKPMGWKQTPLGKMLRKKPGALQSGPFGSQLHNHDFIADGTVLAVGVDNVHDAGFESGRGRRITKQKYAELKKFTLEPGDVLITIMGTIGRTCVFPEWAVPAICTKHVYRIQVDCEGLHPEYLSASIRFSPFVRSQLGASVTGQIVAGITSRDLRALRIDEPPIELQRKFARVKTGLDEDRKKRKRNREEIDRLFNLLLHRAFCGDLTAKWREAHVQELLAEMEQQAKALRGVC